MHAFRRFGALVRPYPWYAALALLMLLLSSGAMLVAGQGLRAIVDHGLAGGLHAGLLLAAVWVLALATGARFAIISWIGERIGADLRRDLFRKLLSGTTLDVGDQLTRLTSDITVVQQIVGSTISVFLRNLCVCIGALGMMLATSPSLTLWVVLVAPLLVWPMRRLNRHARTLARTAQNALSGVGVQAEEALNGLTTVRAFTFEDHIHARFSAASETARRLAVRRVQLRAILISSTMILSFSGVSFLLWLGSQRVMTGSMQAGTLSAFVFYATTAAITGGALSEAWGDIIRAMGSMDRLQDVMDLPTPVPAPEHPAQLAPAVHGRSIVLESVDFAYPKRSNALDALSFAIPAGQTVALVGPSGAGKSTILGLLLRFMDPQSGRVLLDGVDIRQLDLHDLRQEFSFVAQDTQLFSGTLSDNIRMGRMEASPQEVEDAARAAHVLDFAQHLPQGLLTQVGAKGMSLSGGQRQRIAIARAMLKNAPVLLLDEATSALDAASEALIQDALAALTKGRTTVVIAHRLATIRRADRILVLQQGRLVEQGTHASLQEHHGLYAQLAALQQLDATRDTPATESMEATNPTQPETSISR